jgi:outer membrane protein assembly factor BamB
VLLRLHAEDGSASWRTPLTHPDASSGGVHIVRTKGEGDVVAAGHFRPASTDDPLAPSRPFVAMLEAPTGAIRWLSVLPAGETTNAWVSDVGLDDAGHVVATLALGSEQPFAVVAFDGSNGTERWRRVLAESSSYLAGANRLTIGPNGRVVAVGMGTWADTGRDATVWSIDGETGSD